MCARHTMLWSLPAILVVASCGSSAPDPILGLRLGTTPSSARERFDPGAPGTFRSEAMGEDLALVWEPEGESDVHGARLEFHLGLLVALRLRTAPSAPPSEGPPMVLTDLSVLTRETTSEEVSITWLARACPTHAAEVRRLVEEHR